MHERFRRCARGILPAGLLALSAASVLGCAGAIAAGSTVALVGAGVVASRCYDRVEVMVTDQLTGTRLCDAEVSFKGDSTIEANSCHHAALTSGKYTLHVSRPGLRPMEMPVTVDTGEKCQHRVQTIYVALERPNYQQPPRRVSAPALATLPDGGSTSSRPVNPTPNATPAASMAPAPVAPPPPSATVAPASVPSADAP
jgi:hypothetical protein